MKSFRIIALSVFISICAFGVVFYAASCKKDGCKGVTCLNGGTCSGGLCNCPTGYTGVTCQTLAFIGTWQGSDTCSPAGIKSVITISAAADTGSVLISAPGSFQSSVQVVGTVSNAGTTITYSNQPITSKISVSGTMTLGSNTSFTQSYTTKDTSSSKFCTGTYSLQ